MRRFHVLGTRITRVVPVCPSMGTDVATLSVGNAIFSKLPPHGPFSTDIFFRADAAAVKLGGPAELKGATAVAGIFKGRAQAAQPALIDDTIGIVVAPGGKRLLFLRLTFGNGTITSIDAVADPTQVADAELEVLRD